jgi:hypothetical protein
MANQWQDVLDLLGQKQAKKASDTLKAKRTYKDELYKASPGYRAQQERDKETKEIKSIQDLADAKKKDSPQEDILRFGKKIKEYRDLAYKEKVITEDDGDNKVDRIEYLPRKDNEIFKGQMEAYSDSLSMANLAQRYKSRTPEIRGIKNEFETLVKKYKEKTPVFTNTGDGTSSAKMAVKRATADLAKKYGKSLPSLISELYSK